MIISLFLCPRKDSNLHASRHTHLKRARLPIPPLGLLDNLSILGAENETRTRDPNLGKVVLYQLSYFRVKIFDFYAGFSAALGKAQTSLALLSFAREFRK